MRDIKKESQRIIKLIEATLKRDGRIYICGNGGSAANSQNLSGDLLACGIPAIALTTDTSVLTSIANDFGYNGVFRRQLNVLGRKGDLLIVFSGSGKSPNCLEVIRCAKDKGIEVADVARIGGGKRFMQTREENHMRIAHLVYSYFHA